MDNAKTGLHEDLMLLSLRDEEGTLESKAGMYRIGLGGALLSELLLAGCISIAEGKKPFVDVVEITPFDDPVLDEALGLIAAAKRRRRAPDWVMRLARVSKLRHRVAVSLCRKGVLAEDEDKVLLIFKRRIYPTIDPEPERQLLEAMRHAIFTDSAEIEDRTSILIGLAHTTGVLRAHFDRRELKVRKSRLEQIASGDLIAGATTQAVRAAQAAQQAMMAAVIVSATVAGTAGSH